LAASASTAPARVCDIEHQYLGTATELAGRNPARAANEPVAGTPAPAQL
jgi:hypothetical protein